MRIAAVNGYSGGDGTLERPDVGSSHASTISPDPPAMSVAESLRRVAGLTPAQRSVLTRLGSAGEPVTAAQLAGDAGIRSSSIRETLDALLAAGLVRRERLPVSGPGRPSFGYSSVVPTDVEGPLRMFLDVLGATVSVLRDTHPTPAAAARQIGVAWADRMVGEAIPDHRVHSARAYAHLRLADHMDKIAFFFSALGFGAAVSEDRREIECRACPFMRAGQVDGLMCEVHRGMAARVVETTSRGRATARLEPWATQSSCHMVLSEK